MTIEEAISDLEQEIMRPGYLTYKGYLDALKLGKEALKRLQVNRKQTTIEWVTLLPGETKE